MNKRINQPSYQTVADSKGAARAARSDPSAELQGVPSSRLVDFRDGAHCEPGRAPHVKRTCTFGGRAMRVPCTSIRVISLTFATQNRMTARGRIAPIGGRRRLTFPSTERIVIMEATIGSNAPRVSWNKDKLESTPSLMSSAAVRD